MHEIKIEKEKVRTDLLLEEEKYEKKKVLWDEKYGIKQTTTKEGRYYYTTIQFEEVTDHTKREELVEVLTEQLKKYLRPKKEDKFLIVGLGNPKSTPDSLGPKTLEEIIVTRYLFSLGEVEDYKNVAILKPDVFGNTGIESISLIKNTIKEINPNKVIIIDALKAAKLERLVKTIQITDSGIHPGSGILNDRGEISRKTMNCEVIAIGVPTVVDKNTITKTPSKENFMVTPTNIDFLIEILSKIIGKSLNLTIHKTNFDK